MKNVQILKLNFQGECSLEFFSLHCATTGSILGPLGDEKTMSEDSLTPPQMPPDNFIKTKSHHKTDVTRCENFVLLWRGGYRGANLLGWVCQEDLGHWSLPQANLIPVLEQNQWWGKFFAFSIYVRGYVSKCPCSLPHANLIHVLQQNRKWGDLNLPWKWWKIKVASFDWQSTP